MRHHDDGARRVLQHLGAHRAQHPLAERVVPAAADDQHVGALGGLAQDGGGDALGDDRVDRDPVRLARYRGQRRLQLLLDVDRLVGPRVQGHRRSRHDHVRVVPRVDGVDGGAP